MEDIGDSVEYGAHGITRRSRVSGETDEEADRPTAARREQRAKLGATKLAKSTMAQTTITRNIRGMFDSSNAEFNLYSSTKD